MVATPKTERSAERGVSQHADADGGLQAWLQVGGAWCLFFNTWGLLNTFGVYQTYYETGALFQASSSTIAWIGAVQGFLLLIIGFLTGPLFDQGYFRTLILTGSFGVVFGHMMLSLCHTYWQVILAQGFVVGLGTGCLFVPSVAIMPAYFKKNLGLALGLASSGSSTGGIIYPVMFHKLVGEVGFRWGTRILAFTALATLLFPIFVMKQRSKPAKVRSLLDMTAFGELDFMLATLGVSLGFIAFYVTVFYLASFSESRHITNASLSIYLLAILNAASVFGRILPNMLADRIGSLNVVIPGSIVFGILQLCMIAVRSVGSIIVVTILTGFFSGIYVATSPLIFAAVTEDKSKMGTRMGMGFAMMSPAVFLGGPAAGAILGSGSSNLHWSGVWAFSGICVLAAGCTFIYARVRQVGMKLVIRI